MMVMLSLFLCWGLGRTQANPRTGEVLEPNANSSHGIQRGIVAHAGLAIQTARHSSDALSLRRGHHDERGLELPSGERPAAIH